MTYKLHLKICQKKVNQHFIVLQNIIVKILYPSIKNNHRNDNFIIIRGNRSHLKIVEQIGLVVHFKYLTQISKYMFYI